MFNGRVERVACIISGGNYEDFSSGDLVLRRAFGFDNFVSLSVCVFAVAGCAPWNKNEYGHM
jgi:hypothetical protein